MSGGMLLLIQGVKMRLVRGNISSQLHLGIPQAEIDEAIKQFYHKQTVYSSFLKDKPAQIRASFYQTHQHVVYLPNKTMDRLLYHLSRFPITIEEEEAPTYDIPDVELPTNPDIPLYSGQEEALSVISGYPDACRLLSLEAGGGKTFTSIHYAARRAKPILVLCKANYLGQWEKEVGVALDGVSPHVVRGSDELLKTLQSDTLYPLVLLSLNTLRSYISRWKEGIIDAEYGPDRLTALLKTGTLLCDETHQELGALFGAFCYINGPEVLGLSATMTADDPKVSKAQRDIFPLSSRYIERETGEYIDYVMYHYSVRKGVPIKYRMYGSHAYSQVAYEKWILASPVRKKAYVDMIVSAYHAAFIKRKPREGDKTLIFVQLTKLSAEVVKALKHRYPDKKVIDFTGSCKKEETIHMDVLVSTIGKSGTALDHWGLTTLINTVSVAKKEQVIQNIKRLRRPKGVILTRYREDYNDVKERLCVQFVNDDIEDHHRHQRSRMTTIKHLLSRIRRICSGVTLP
jgi:hypothetical protein